MQYYLSIVIREICSKIEIRESFFTIISRFFALAKLSALKVIILAEQNKIKMHSRRITNYESKKQQLFATHQLDMASGHQLQSDSRNLSDIHLCHSSMSQTGNSNLVNNGKSDQRVQDRDNSSRQCS